MSPGHACEIERPHGEWPDATWSGGRRLLEGPVQDSVVLAIDPMHTLSHNQRWVPVCLIQQKGLNIDAGRRM